MQIIPRTINNVIVKEGYLKYYCWTILKMINEKWSYIVFTLIYILLVALPSNQSIS